MKSQENSRKKQTKASTTESLSAKKKKKTILPYKIVSVISVFLFIALSVYMAYFQVYKSKDLLDSPYNKRTEEEADKVRRGTIYSYEGNILAYTDTDDQGNETRVYPCNDLFSHTVGYLVYGSSGLEASQNKSLLTSNSNLKEKISNDLNEEKLAGDDLITTFNLDLQQACYDALGDNRGAVFVMDVSTGAVLADVSKPSFDANTVEQDWDWLTSEENEETGIFVNRATQGLYPPGSTFKIVTALAYLRQYGSFDGFEYDCDGYYEHGNYTIHCAGNNEHGSEDFSDAMANSCNCAFAYMATELIDKDILAETASSLGFNQDFEIGISSVASQFTLDSNSADELTMQTGIGQGNTLATPMQMCMIVQAIANNGNMLVPKLMDRVQSSSGAVVQSYTAQDLGSVMTPEEAAALKEILKGVVQRGTASELSDYPYDIAGKTGTAQYGDIENDTSHSWFAGFSNTGQNDIAVCVLVEDGGTNGTPAYRMAGQIFEAYFGY